MSLMASFVLSFFPRDVLDEILDLNESVSEGLSQILRVFVLGTFSTAEKSKDSLGKVR